MNNQIAQTPPKFSFFDQFTEDQIKSQYRANYDGLVRMRNKAVKTGKKVNGYTIEQLEKMVNQYKEYCK